MDMRRAVFCGFGDDDFEFPLIVDRAEVISSLRGMVKRINAKGDFEPSELTAFRAILASTLYHFDSEAKVMFEQ